MASNSVSSESGSANTTALGKRTATGAKNDKAKESKKPRQRQSLSCQECRRLKLKCDRVFPCSSCKRRNCPEICPTGVSKPPGRAIEIQAEFKLLIKRVEFLEGLVEELGAKDRIPPPLKLQHASKRSTAFSKEVEEKIQDASNAQAPIEEEEGSEEEEVGGSTMDGSEEPQPVESLVIGVGSLRIKEEGGRFLGASAGSAYYFDEDEEDSTEEVSTPDDRPQTEGHPVIQIGPSRKGMEEIEHYRSLLPPIDEARRLAQNYFRFLAFQFTPMSAEEFWDDYWPAAFTPNDRGPTKLAAVYIVLSLGSLFDPASPATFNQQALDFFLRSHNVMAAAKALSHNTLATSQTIQLSGSFLLCQHDLQEGGETFFPLIGIGLRLLVTQALHRDGTLFGLTGQELNKRRRIFWELITIERMQALLSGRPYMLSDSQFDTKMPDDAEPFDVCKWKLGTFIGKVIDSAFSIVSPSYSTILELDEELRGLVRNSPKSVRSGVLPDDAFLVKPNAVPRLPTPSAPNPNLIERLRQHTMDQMYSQVLFYLHKPAFAHALTKFSEEPLKSPYGASVAALSLETAVYLLAVAKSWIHIDPILCPRWWHIYFHAFAASVAQSSLVIKSPTSILAPHAWGQINEAVAIFEQAGSGGAPCAMFVPRLKTLREKAFLSLQNSITIPHGVGREDWSEALLAGTDVSRSILNPPARLERKQARKKSPTSGTSVSPNNDFVSLHTAVSAPPPAPVDSSHHQYANEVPYTPFDSPIYQSNDSSPLQHQPQQAFPPYPVAQAPPYPQFAYQPPPIGHQQLPHPPPIFQDEDFPSISDFSRLASFSADPAPSTAYEIQPESRLGFGTFATDFPSANAMSSGVVRSSQDYMQNPGSQSGELGYAPYAHSVAPSTQPSLVDFDNFIPR